jgi:hypothetical protein
MELSSPPASFSFRYFAQVWVCSILRMGIIPGSSVGYIGMERDEATAEAN